MIEEEPGEGAKKIPKETEVPETGEAKEGSICPKCGKKLPSIAKYCGYCGESLRREGEK